MDLLERDLLLDELRDALAATTTGGRVALVAGEAGIGKSALVKRFTEQAEGTARCLFGACDPLLTPRALGPLHDIARQTGGRLAALLADGGPREQLFAALLDELDRRLQPQVVVVEDAHWADEATLDLLMFAGRRIEQTNALLIVTYREDELAPGHPLLTVVGSLPQHALRRLRLEPLSEAAVAELAARAGRPADGLRRRTGGNPLLVTEVLAANDTGVPLTVRDLVLARLAALPPGAQEVVRLVAVVPTRVELEVLEAALRPDPADVEACVAAGLLVVDDEAAGFRHELLRQAVEGSLSPLARRALNRRVLEVLTGRPVDVARLAHHAREAGDVEAVLRFAPEAARQAAAVAAHREAAGHYRAALPHTGRLPAPARAELLEAFSIEAYMSGVPGDAVDARQEAVRIREEIGDLEKVGQSLRWLSRLHWWAGNRRAAETSAVRAIEVLEPLPPGRHLAMAYSNQAQLDMLANRSAVAIEWATKAIELAERVGDTESLSHALTNLGSARLQLGDAGGRDDLERAYQVAIAAGLDDHAARALVNRAASAADVRDYANAAADLDRALAFVEQRDLIGYYQHLLGHRARLRLDTGDLAGAEADAHAALDDRASSSICVIHGLVVHGLLQARRGDPGAVDTLQEATERAYPTGEIQMLGPVAAARAEHAWLQGDEERIAEETAAPFELAVANGHPWYAGELGFWLHRAGALTEVPEDAPPPYRMLLAGDWRGAAAWWAAIGCDYEQAQALASGDDDDALLEAVRLLDGLGARQTAQRVRRRIRERGNLRVPRGPSRTTAANPAGLTGRQVEVLTLLAEGLGNAEIAARLSLSAKTVEHHVTALLAKLGVTSRRDAIAAAGQLGVVARKDEGAAP
jgi:DNA-binding CsgD family transcriptional regulator/tetratricopeptide (TPR) repeat protein